MKKKLLYIFCSVFVAGIALTGCVGGRGTTPSTESSTVQSSEQANSVGLNIEKRDMTLGDTLYLVARADGATENAEFEWESSNEQVATVDEEGTVIAMSSGEAVISATYGTGKAECSVTVATNGNIPTLQFIADFKGNDINVSLNDQINLDCNVLFNQKTFDDIAVRYTLSDPTVGKVEAGVFKPTKLGSTTVTVTADWRGLTSEQYETMSQVITVNVKELKAIILDNGALGEDIVVDLYSRATFCGATFKNVQTVAVKAMEGENEKTCTGTVIEGEDVIDYDDATRTITGKALGEAKIKYAFTDTNDDEYSVVLSVRVSSPIVDNYTTSLGTGMFSGWDDNTEGYTVDTDGDNQVLPFDIGTVKGVYMADDIYYAEDLETKENLYVGGKVKFTNTSTRALEYKDVIIQTVEGNLYEATLEIYTRIINSKEDLRMFDFDAATTTRTLTGYYALGSDIVDTEEIYNTTYSTKSYFQGVFDGKGHSLTFKTVGGLFSNKIKGAGNLFVKNVNFKDCTITVNKDNPSAHTLIGSLDSSSTVTLQNVSVSLSEQTYTNFAEDTAPNLYVVAYDNVQNRENKTEGNLTSFINCINVMVEIDYNKIPEAETTSETKFITIISKLRNGTSNFNVVVLNYDDTKTYARFVKLLDVTDLTEVSMGSTAVTQYDSYEALKTYFDANASALATFDTTYWDVENGYPVWKED